MSVLTPPANGQLTSAALASYAKPTKTLLRECYSSFRVGSSTTTRNNLSDILCPQPGSAAHLALVREAANFKLKYGRKKEAISDLEQLWK